MERFENNLKYLDFTQYEAKILITLLRYEHLDASELAKYSGVPQPKIYETMEKLASKKLIEILPMTKKKEFKIVPKHILQKIISEKVEEIKDINTQVQNSIDTLYSSEKTSEIPFYGIAGNQNIEENLIALIDEATVQISGLLPDALFTDPVIKKLNERSNQIEVNLIFQDESHILDKKPRIIGAHFYQLIHPAFDIIKNIGGQLRNMIPVDTNDSMAFSIINKLFTNIDDIFGLFVVDNRKSMFFVPIPIGIRMAVVSTLPEMIEFQSTGIDEILKASNEM